MSKKTKPKNRKMLIPVIILMLLGFMLGFLCNDKFIVTNMQAISYILEGILIGSLFVYLLFRKDIWK